MVIEIRFEVEYKDGRKETYFPILIHFSENRVYLVLKGNKTESIDLSKVEIFTIDQKFDCVK